jgi:hypothetical protein
MDTLLGSADRLAAASVQRRVDRTRHMKHWLCCFCMRVPVLLAARGHERRTQRIRIRRRDGIDGGAHAGEAQRAPGARLDENRQFAACGPVSEDEGHTHVQWVEGCS